MEDNQPIAQGTADQPAQAIEALPQSQQTPSPLPPRKSLADRLNTTSIVIGILGGLVGIVGGMVGIAGFVHERQAQRAQEQAQRVQERQKIQTAFQLGWTSYRIYWIADVFASKKRNEIEKKEHEEYVKGLVTGDQEFASALGVPPDAVAGFTTSLQQPRPYLDANVMALPERSVRLACDGCLTAYELGWKMGIAATPLPQDHAPDQTEWQLFAQDCNKELLAIGVDYQFPLVLGSSDQRLIEINRAIQAIIATPAK